MSSYIEVREKLLSRKFDEAREAIKLANLDSVQLGGLFVDAVSSLRFESADILLEFGVNPQLNVSNGELLINEAIVNGNEKVFNYLVKAGHDINAKGANGDTPLIKACMVPIEKTSVNMVKTLVEAGADVNIRNESGVSAIFYAISNGNEKKVDIILERNPNLTYVNISGDNVCHYIAANDENKSDMAIKLFDYIRGQIKNGEIDINKNSVTSGLPISDAMIRGQRMLKLFLDEGADPHARTFSYGVEGATTLMFAALYDCDGEATLVKSLLDMGVNPLSVDHEGKNALDYVLMNGLLGKGAVFKALLDAGLNPDVSESKNPVDFYTFPLIMLSDPNSKYRAKNELDLDFVAVDVIRGLHSLGLPVVRKSGEMGENKQAMYSSLGLAMKFDDIKSFDLICSISDLKQGNKISLNSEIGFNLALMLKNAKANKEIDFDEFLQDPNSNFNIVLDVAKKNGFDWKVSDVFGISPIEHIFMMDKSCGLIANLIDNELIRVDERLENGMTILEAAVNTGSYKFATSLLNSAYRNFGVEAVGEAVVSAILSSPKDEGDNYESRKNHRDDVEKIHDNTIQGASILQEIKSHRSNREKSESQALSERRQFLDFIGVSMAIPGVIETVDEDGNGLLALAAATDQLDVSLIVLNKGYNVNAANKYGETALHHAVENGVDKNVIKTLMSAGADSLVENIDGWTPVDVCNNVLVKPILVGARKETSEFKINEEGNYNMDDVKKFCFINILSEKKSQQFRNKKQKFGA